MKVDQCTEIEHSSRPKVEKYTSNLNAAVVQRTLSSLGTKVYFDQPRQPSGRFLNVLLRLCSLQSGGLASSQRPRRPYFFAASRQVSQWPQLCEEAADNYVAPGCHVAFYYLSDGVFHTGDCFSFFLTDTCTALRFSSTVVSKLEWLTLSAQTFQLQTLNGNLTQQYFWYLAQPNYTPIHLTYVHKLTAFCYEHFSENQM